MAPVRLLAPVVREDWKPAPPTNRLREAEKRISDAIIDGLNARRRFRSNSGPSRRMATSTICDR